MQRIRESKKSLNELNASNSHLMKEAYRLYCYNRELESIFSYKEYQVKVIMRG